nr:unnamed protein product [Spirometra erinaceieuropaei]
MDGRPPKQFLYEDVVTGAPRHERQTCCYKTYTKTWEDLTQDRPAWRRAVKTETAIYEANQIAAAKAKGEARKSQAPLTHNANNQLLPTCSRYQRIFHGRIGLVGHLQTPCTDRPTTAVSPTAPDSTPTAALTLIADAQRSQAPLPTVTVVSIILVTTSAATTTTLSLSLPLIAEQNFLYGPPTTTLTVTNPTFSSGDLVLTCSYCDHPFASSIGLVGRLRILHTAAGTPTPEVPIYTHRSAFTIHVSATVGFTVVSTHITHPAHPPTLPSPALSTTAPTTSSTTPTTVPH